ncbi:MAG TPA: molybdopterin-dependent oxidoreductase, partial [Actinomycetota bacterium]
MPDGSTPYPVIPAGVSEFREAGAEAAAGWQAPEASEITLVPTHCCYCGVQCGMFLKVDGDGHVFGVEPSAHDINKGKLCPKGVTAYQQVDHPDRLLHPLVRDGRGGELRRASWEEALDRVAGEIRRIQEAYGRDAFGVYSGSSLVTENTYLMGKFARVALKTKHIDYNGRLCMVSAAAANKKAFGIDRAANPWRDMLSTQVVLLAGANVAECFPVMSHYVWGARDRGAKLIVVDPRETPLARTADLHVPLRPGTDAAFFAAVLHAIDRDGRIDEVFIAERTVGWDDVRAAVAGWPPSRAAEICGIDPELIERTATIWGTAERAMAFHARGIEHQIQGVENALSIINLVLATGQIGAEGKGYGTITGQGNGQGGREHGQKADQLPGARDIENPEHRAFIADYWGIDEAELPHAGVSAVELVHLMETGEVRGFLALCNNPFVSMP